MPDAIPKKISSIIMRMALDAIDETKPAIIQFGTVESEKPLKIRISQKLLLEEADLFLSHLVRDHMVDITVSHKTGESGLNEGSMTDYKTHSHDYIGRKQIMLHNGLKNGERVLLLREQGGQRYLVLDRLSEITPEGEWL